MKWTDLNGFGNANLLAVATGDAIDKPIANDAAPNWDAVRTLYWKNRAAAIGGTVLDIITR